MYLHEEERTETVGTFKTSELKCVDDKGNEITLFPSEVKIKMRYAQSPGEIYWDMWDMRISTWDTVERVWAEVELPTNDMYARYKVAKQTVERSVTFRVDTWSFETAEFWKKKLNISKDVEVFEYTQLEDKKVVVKWSWEETV
jgi:hypothetical protein